MLRSLVAPERGPYHPFMRILAEATINDGEARDVKCLAVWRVDLVSIKRWMTEHSNGQVFVFIGPPVGRGLKRTSKHSIPNRRMKQLQTLNTRGQLRLMYFKKPPSEETSIAVMTEAVNPNKAESEPAAD